MRSRWAPVSKSRRLTKSRAICADATTDLTADISFEIAMLIRAFEFDKELMKEHFNENYLESEKFPKATFKGTISNISEAKLAADGTYPVKLTGQLTIHGVTKDISSAGNLQVKGGKITAASEFIVGLSDYNVKVEKAYASKISEKVKIVVDLPLSPMAK